QSGPTWFAHVGSVATKQADIYTRRRSASSASIANVDDDCPMEVQIFGVKKSADSRKALRFFSERRIRTHFVDLIERAMTEGELQRFIHRFGVEALIDRDGKRYEELGLRHSHVSAGRWVDRLLADPTLLRLPLVRR